MAVYAHRRATAPGHHERARLHPKPTLTARGNLLTLVAILCAAFNLRTAVSSISPLLEHISRDLGFTTTTITIFGTLPPAIFALTSLVATPLATRFGLERLTIAAMFIAATGTFTRAFATNTEALIALSTLALIGMGLGNVIVPPLIKRYFPRNLAPASTGQLIAMHAGACVPPVLAVPLTQLFGWRVSTGLWAAFGVAAAWLWCAVLWRRQARTRMKIADAPAARTGSTHLASAVLKLKGLRRTRTAWNLALILAAASWNQFIVFAWLPPVLVSAGFSTSFAGLMVSVVISTSLITALLLPHFIAKVDSGVRSVLACCGALALGYVGLAFMPAVAPALWSVLLGIGGGLFVVALTLINLRTESPAGATALSAFVQGWGAALAMGGPLLFGVLHAALGGWAGSILITGALSLAAVAFALVRHRPGLTLERELRAQQPPQ